MTNSCAIDVFNFTALESKDMIPNSSKKESLFTCFKNLMAMLRFFLQHGTIFLESKEKNAYLCT